MSELIRVVANLNLGKRIRRESYGGEEHIVAPASLIVPGVLDGSDGPLYYPADEIAKNPLDWNHIPVVVYHPTVNGVRVSAREPGILENQGVGYVFNSKADDSLTAEAWFNVRRTLRVDSRVVESLEAGDPIELSTGLFLSKTPAPDGAVFNTKTGEAKPYTFITGNYKPDHLAVLPDKVGACSIKDGCGILVNALSHGDLAEALRTKLKARFPASSSNVVDDFWIVDIFDKYLVYERNGKYYRLGFKQSKANGVSLDSGSPDVVVQETKYVISNQKEPSNMAKLSDDERKGLVDGLIGNCECWVEDDRAILNEMPDLKLKQLTEHVEKSAEATAVANAARKGFTDPGGISHVWNTEKQEWETKPAKPADPNPTPVANAKPTEPKPMTEDEWMKNAPPSVQEDLAFARNEKAAQKSKLIDQLVANVAQSEQAAQRTRLEGRSLLDLQADVQLLPKQASPEASAPVANWQGSATPAISQQAVDQDDVLPLPTINWKEETA